MKNFALQLEGCSKEDRKKVIKLAKSVGFKWGDYDRFKSNKWDYLHFTREDDMYYSFHTFGACPIYQMPRDWNKIQEALGVEPKSGKAYVVSDRIIRFKNRTYPQSGYQETDVYSQLCNNGNYYEGTKEVFIKEELIEATLEEADELIRAEHDNGVHWDGENMVEIPEYVECVKTFSTGFTIGKIYNFPNPIDDDDDSRCITKMNGALFQFKPSTKQAYEAQNKPKLEADRLGFNCTGSGNLICNSVSVIFDMETGKWATIIEPSELEKLRAENERLMQKLTNI